MCDCDTNSFPTGIQVHATCSCRENGVNNTLQSCAMFIGLLSFAESNVLDPLPEAVRQIDVQTVV